MSAVAPGRPRAVRSQAVIVLGDGSTPLGRAVARRLAPGTRQLEVAVARLRDAAELEAEVVRLRELPCTTSPIGLHKFDVATPGGSAALLAAASGMHRRLEAVIVVGAPGPGSVSRALQPLLPLLSVGSATLGKLGDGRMVAVLDLTGPCSVGWTGARRLRMTSAFEALIRATARNHYPQNVCVNGLVVESSSAGVQRRLDMDAGVQAQTAAAIEAHATAATMVSVLTSAASCGITGQVFRIGGAPQAPDDDADLLELGAASRL